jgi:protein-disulfide isomerase/flagellar basal body-associated protein FliL
MSSRALFALLAAVVACRSSGATDAAPAATAAKVDAKAASSKLDPTTPVAKIGSQTITAAELDEHVKSELRRADNEFQEKAYQIRSQGLEQLVNMRLTEVKAKEAKTTVDDLLKKEIKDKLKDPTPEQVQTVYDRAKNSGQPVPPLDQVRDRIVSYLKDEQGRTATNAFYSKLRSESKVEMLLPAFTPPRVEVAAVGPALGPEKAPITIVEFSDFQCPFCGRAEPTVKQVMELYKDKVRLVFRDFPLPGHPFAQKASEAALCAHDQGKYWEMHDKLFANQQQLELSSLKGYAKELGLNTGKFDKCLDSGSKAKDIEASTKAGMEAGVSGTPAFFVNGVLLSGAVPVDNFKAIIDAELAKK